MMAVRQNPIAEGDLIFSFPNEADVTKYDEWSFYRNQFIKIQHDMHGTKGVDIVFINDSALWLIEIKDYRLAPKASLMDLSAEIALKVRDTLAGLMAAKCNANDLDEKAFAERAIKKAKIKVVLHFEPSTVPSRLFFSLKDLANLKTKLKQLLSAVDTHPIVVSKATLSDNSSITWVVQ